MVAWKRAADLDSNQTEAMYNLWRASMKSDPAQAPAYRERFAAMQRQKQLTTQAETLANFGLASANRGDYLQAISQLREAIEQCGKCASRPVMYKDLALIECKSGDLQGCEKNLLTAQSLKPEDQDVAKALAIVRLGKVKDPSNK
jgi:Flp pilus assembly protein TadD